MWFTRVSLQNPVVATMVLLDGGGGVTWPEEIDYSADFLRNEAFPYGVPAP